MGTDCAPFLANLFLYSYEYQWIDKQKKAENWHVLKYFVIAADISTVFC
jgi:hypothetical protein